MPVNSDRKVKFRKDGYPDLAAWVRIVPAEKKASNEAHSVRFGYKVFWNDYLRFTDPTGKLRPSRIDGTTRIVWDELTKPAALDVPARYRVPFVRGVAFFQDEI